jgi:predicted O-linked N-acetylglucosamine transferase (SPINDLY family)
LLYGLAFAPGATAADIHAEALEYDRVHVAPLRPLAPSHPNESNLGRRLRIGYVSPDFRSHCQALFMTPLLRHHDHERFEIICYSTTTRRDAVTQSFKPLADVWRDVADYSDDALATLIRDDRVDIIIDLTMHMSNNRALVFARKPAPVQICWLAYPGTTGNRSIDYRVSDRHIDPPGLDDAYYVEQTLRLPDTFWCYEPQSTLEVKPLPALTNGFVTFGCLNNFAKVTAVALQNFARVLAALPGSRLLLSCPVGATRERVNDLFAEQAVDPARVEFIGRKPRDGYLSLYDRIDVCLDTVPYNGHTTSLDAIWMGVPVVTLVGDTVVGRAGLCLAENLGMPELVARTPEEFVARAIDLAAELERLARLRRDLRGRLERSALMNAPRFARNLEALYREAWQRYCAERA